MLLSPAYHCCVRHFRPSNVDHGATDMPVYGKRLQFVQSHQANAVCHFRADPGTLHEAVLGILVRSCPESVKLSLVSRDQLSSRNDARRFEPQDPTDGATTHWRLPTPRVRERRSVRPHPA